MLKMEKVSKTYRTDTVETHALREFSLTVNEGEFVSVTGPSGSGKTTFLNIAGMLEKLTSGTYELDGRDISKLSDKERSRVRNEKIGFIFQSFNLLPQITSYENVEMPLLFGGVSKQKRRKRVEELMERVGLADRMDHRPTELSGGQMQRVAIARALAMEPDIILADEPTGNLDTSSGGDIMDLFGELWQQGHTVIIITHDPALAQRAQRQVEIRDGLITLDNRN